MSEKNQNQTRTQNQDKDKPWSFRWIVKKIFLLYIAYYAAKTAYHCNRYESKFIMIPVVLLALIYSPYYLAYYFIYHYILRVPCAMSVGNPTVLLS